MQMSEQEGNEEGLEENEEHHRNKEFANVSQDQAEHFDGA